MKTHLHVPLACNSHHHPSVHFSWPVAEIIRCAKRSSNYLVFIEGRNRLLRRFQASNVHSGALERARSLPYQFIRLRNHARKAESGFVFRLILPFHGNLRIGNVIHFMSNLASRWNIVLVPILRAKRGLAPHGAIRLRTSPRLWRKAAAAARIEPVEVWSGGWRNVVFVFVSSGP